MADAVRWPTGEVNAPVADDGQSGDHAAVKERSTCPPTARPFDGPVDLSALAAALEASWDGLTAYRGAVRPGNPAWGQCYPTSWVVQWFCPDAAIARGEVWTPFGLEHHFWNVRGTGNDAQWIDLSWKQFPPGSVVRRFSLLDRAASDDSEGTRERCALLLHRVLIHLGLADTQESRGP